MSPKELKTLIKTLKDNGVVSYKADGLELLLDPNYAPQKPSKAKKPKDSAQVLQEQVGALIPELTDEEWLMSTNLPTAEDETVQ